MFWLRSSLQHVQRWNAGRWRFNAGRWNVMAHAQKPDFVFRRNGRVHLNRWGRQFSRLLAAEVCASAVVMLDTPCSKVVWRVLATHSIRQFPLHFPSRASPCAITFQLESAYSNDYRMRASTEQISRWKRLHRITKHAFRTEVTDEAGVHPEFFIQKWRGWACLEATYAIIFFDFKETCSKIHNCNITLFATACMYIRI